LKISGFLYRNNEAGIFEMPHPPRAATAIWIYMNQDRRGLGFRGIALQNENGCDQTQRASPRHTAQFVRHVDSPGFSARGRTGLSELHFNSAFVALSPNLREQPHSHRAPTLDRISPDVRASVLTFSVNRTRSIVVWLVLMMVQLSIRGFQGVVVRRLHCFSLFWHALDIIWVLIFTIVYLMGVLP
jgi:hypothetical protein